MPDITTQDLKNFFSKIPGQEISLPEIRREFDIRPGTKSFDLVRSLVFQIAEQGIIRKTGKRGFYKVIEKVLPVQVYGTDRQRRPPFELCFPRDFTAGIEMAFADAIIVREGDLITVGGDKSTGKTQLCLSFCAENIDANPVLMGNEYTVFAEGVYEPAPRFLARLDTMKSWVEWTNGTGQDKFILLPVREDYAEHIIANRINIIDWINIDADRLWGIGKVLEEIKARLGRGIAIVALQKGEGTFNPRGGQFVRDFSDFEILLDPFGHNPHDVMLTIKGVKETTRTIVGKTYAYTIGESGTKAFNFREVTRCKGCAGSGKTRGHDCDECYGTGKVDRPAKPPPFTN